MNRRGFAFGHLAERNACSLTRGTAADRSSTRSRPPGSYALYVAAFGAILVSRSITAEQVTATWFSAYQTAWDYSIFWSTHSTYPNNTPQTTYAVVVNHPYGMPGLRQGLAITVDSILLDAEDGGIGCGGTLVVLDRMQVNKGTFYLGDNASLSVGNGIILAGGGFSAGERTLSNLEISGTSGHMNFYRTVLDNVAVVGDVTTQGVTIRNGLKLYNATVWTEPWEPLTFSGHQSITGSGAFVLGNRLHVNGSVTFGDQITIRSAPHSESHISGGDWESGEGWDITIKGLLSAQAQNGRLTIDSDRPGTITNAGTFEARNGSTLRIKSEHLSNYDPVTGTLTGGNWHVYGDSYLIIDGGWVSTNRANILMSGSPRDPSYTHAFGFDSRLNNEGSLVIEQGARAHASEIHNSGTLVVGAGSSLDLYRLGGDGNTVIEGTLGTMSFEGRTADNVRWRAGSKLELYGDARFERDTGSPGAYNLDLQVLYAKGTASFTSSQHLAGVTTWGRVNLEGTGSVLRTRSLNHFGYGYLDLTTNALVVEADESTFFEVFEDIYGSVGATRHEVTPWVGAGIGSSAAFVNSESHGLAILLNRDEQGNAILTEFGGEAVNATDVIVAYTLNGDSDLDFMITADDYHRIDRGFLKRRRAVYRNGDFDYNYVIDLNDYALIDAAFLYQNSSPAVAVPEPSTVTLGLAGGVLLTLRRRRRHP